MKTVIMCVKPSGADMLLVVRLCVYIYVCVCKCASASLWVDGWMEEVKRGVEGGETPPGLTVLRVLHLANAAIRCGPLVVVLRQSQRPDPRPR